MISDIRENTLAANAGARVRELMERIGHENERAALVYLHSSEERQHQIADTLSKLATEELKRGSKRQAASPPPGDRARHGHETGSKPLEDHPQEPGKRPDLHGKMSAPSATRTRDLLLRRQLLYPLSYRGQPGAAAAGRHSTGAI
jgi:hypothetical protein